MTTSPCRPRVVTIAPWVNPYRSDSEYRYRVVCAECSFRGPIVLKKGTASRHMDAHRYVGRHRAEA